MPRQTRAWTALIAPETRRAATKHRTRIVIVSAGMASTRMPPAIHAIRAIHVNARRECEPPADEGSSALTNMPHASRTTSTPSDANGWKISTAPPATAMTPIAMRNGALRVHVHVSARRSRARARLRVEAMVLRLEGTETHM